MYHGVLITVLTLAVCKSTTAATTTPASATKVNSAVPPNKTPDKEQFLIRQPDFVDQIEEHVARIAIMLRTPGVLNFPIPFENLIDMDTIRFLEKIEDENPDWKYHQDKQPTKTDPIGLPLTCVDKPDTHYPFVPRTIPDMIGFLRDEIPFKEKFVFDIYECQPSSNTFQGPFYMLEIYLNSFDVNGKIMHSRPLKVEFFNNGGQEIMHPYQFFNVKKSATTSGRGF